MPCCRHAIKTWRDDGIQNFLLQGVIHHRGRGVGSHSAGIWPGVAVTNLLVILRRSKGQGGFAITQKEHAGFFTAEKFFDNHFGTGIAEGAVETIVDRGMGLFKRQRNGDTFSPRPGHLL